MGGGTNPMINRPTIAASLLAEVNESAASRILRKLDKDPAVADSWTWSEGDPGWQVEAGSETVSLAKSRIASRDDLSCTCLLSPKCFHLLAVCNSLAIAEDDPADTDAPASRRSVNENEDTPPTGSLPSSDDVSAEQMGASDMMAKAVAEILSSGLRAAGGGIQSKLLRAIHECRATGLHRLAAAGLRILNHARLIRKGSEEFIPDEAVRSIQEALLVAQQISATETSPSAQWIGTARRRYRPVASLKLNGLCCEPVLTASGYAGVVTWMLSEKGDVVSTSDVQPGTASRILQAWKSGVTLAGLAMSHADLSQQRLLVSKATISEDGRVGGSDSAKAVPSKHEGWNCDAIKKRFEEPIVDQVKRYFDQSDVVGKVTNEGASLMFLTGTICGYDDTALVLRLDNDSIVRLTIAIDTEDLPYRDNLTLLARAAGLRIRCVTRLIPLQPGDFQLLAIGTAGAVSAKQEKANAPELKTGAAGAHIDLGLEALQRSQLTTAEQHPVEASEIQHQGSSTSDIHSAPAEGILIDWLRAIATGGRHTLSRSAIQRLIKDARHLEANFQPTASQVLMTLAQQTIETQTTLEGLRFPADSAQLASSWLATAIVHSTTHQHLQHSAWRASLDDRAF